MARTGDIEVLRGAVTVTRTTGGLWLAQCAARRHAKSMRGADIVFDLHCAGTGVRRQQASKRCWGETGERVVASAPETIVRHVFDSGVVERPIHRDWITPYTNEQIPVASLRDCAFWCRGVGLSSGATYSVPASHVILQWNGYTDDFAGECDATGLASAARSWSVCVMSGLLEVLERDAVMRSWRVPSWDITGVECSVLGSDLREILADSNATCELYDVGDVCPVLLALVLTERGLTCGSAGGTDIASAADRSVREALMLQHSLAALQAVATAGAPVRVPRTSQEHVLFGAANAESVSNWYRSRARDEMRARPAATSVKGLSDLVRAKRGHEPIAIDLTTPDVSSGHRVCRVVVPFSMRKEWDHGRRFFVPSYSGVENEMPHPFG